MQPVRCSYCGHAGFIAGEGLHLVFRAGRECCFTVGGQAYSLAMSIPADAMAAYRWSGLTQEALARHAAEWLLLLGRMAGTFTLTPEQAPFLGFNRYLQDRIPHFRPHVA